MAKAFTITRSPNATAQQVWLAGLVAQGVACCGPPRHSSATREGVKVDVRVGGHYRYAMVNDDTGERVVTGGVYKEVAPYERLVSTWGEPGADPKKTPVVTITLEPEENGTRIIFELRGVSGQPGDGFFYDGWDEAVDVFEECLAYI